MGSTARMEILTRKMDEHGHEPVDLYKGSLPMYHYIISNFPPLRCATKSCIVVTLGWLIRVCLDNPALPSVAACKAWSSLHSLHSFGDEIVRVLALILITAYTLNPRLFFQSWDWECCDYSSPKFMTFECLYCWLMQVVASLFMRWTHT